MDTAIKAPDLSRLLGKVHENKWVAFSPDYGRIIDYSPELSVLHKKIGGKKVIYYKVLPADTIFAPVIL
ncbi:hypothetical protein A2853_01285 [Candidatus Kaiserbacteria bacterium RIFCSPHIGHO2_01_FULL_55_17]|uniref:DUF5678 domain-containing protein n=1 Tax=Candidatus Kaiserbacteria bacterium RIFCSPHIGHO2_01_FULL_55_17 TaxID=1798484 RepID=A0A1F6D9V5_9BACT|nr:MAG: hypothetical protein A2853_01285 [Candidatus Kaiserbacteria bacterium RIFCSPHIGHO2_01_FULL_55_17]